MNGTPNSSNSPTANMTTKTDVLAYGALQISNRHRRQSFAGWDRTIGFHKRGVAGHYHGGSPNVSVSQPNRRLGLAAQRTQGMKTNRPDREPPDVVSESSKNPAHPRPAHPRLCYPIAPSGTMAP